MLNNLKNRKATKFSFCLETRNNVMYYPVNFHENPYDSFSEIVKNDHGLHIVVLILYN